MFREQTKPWLVTFTAAMMAGLTAAGVNAEQTLPYYLTLSAVAVHLTHQVGLLLCWAGAWLCVGTFNLKTIFLY